MRGFRSVDPAEDEHRENDIAVLTADEDIAEAIIRDGPNEGDDFIAGCGKCVSVCPQNARLKAVAGGG